MCVSKPHSQPSARPDRGFSLIELLVAVVLVSLLMAGMFNIFKATASNFQTSVETLGIQRNARWGLQQLQEEVLQAGYLLPPRVVTDIQTTSATAQPPLLMAATDYTPTDAALPVDEIQSVMDLPLNVQGIFDQDTAAGTTTWNVKIPYGASDIQAGDWLFVQDSNWEILRVKTASSTSIVIESDATKFVDAYGNDSGSLLHASLEQIHKKGCPFTFVRSLQVVRYTVVPRKLDPSDPNAVVPCLVRQSRALSGNAGAVWAPDKDTVQAGEQIILEGVTGFRVDWSLDGGKTWIVKDGSSDGTWDSTRTYVDKWLKSSTSPFVKQSGGIANVSDPFWMNYAPVLIRIDIETRTRSKRTENNPASTADNPVATYKTRHETLMLSPRNFSLGIP